MRALRAEIVVSSHGLADGFDTHVLEASSFSDLLKEYTKFLRDNCIYEDEIIDASVTPSGAPFEAGMVSLKTDSHNG